MKTLLRAHQRLERPCRHLFPAIVLIAAGLVTGLATATDLADGAVIDEESVVFFTNGRALRVAGLRVEGDWVYLTVSKRTDPEEEPSEIGVLRRQIDHLEADEALQQSMRNVPITQRGRVANGARASGPANVVSTQVVEKPGSDVPHVPAAGSEDAKLYRPRSAAPDIDPDTAGAGSRFFKPLRNLRVPNRYKQAARGYQNTLRKQREAEAEAAASGEDAPCLMPTFKFPPGYTPPEGYTHPCLESDDTDADAEAPAADGEPKS